MPNSNEPIENNFINFKEYYDGGCVNHDSIDKDDHIPILQRNLKFVY